MTTNMPPVRLDFENLPLVEASARITLAVPLQLTFKIAQDIATELKPEFPEVLEPKGLEHAPGFEGEIQISKMIGVDFGGHSQGLRIHLQPNLLVARWTKPAGADAARYPRFDALKSALWRAYQALQGTASERLVPIVVNMVYTNVFFPDEPNSVLEDYLSQSVYVEAMKSGQPMEFVISWREQGSIDVRLDLRPATVKSKPDAPAYRLATGAGMFLKGDVDKQKALEAVHIRLQHLFRGVLSEKAKALWGLKEVGLDDPA